MSGTNQSVALQQYQPIPNLDSPVVNPDLTITIPWYQLLIGLWRRSGLSSSPVTVKNIVLTEPGASPINLTIGGTPFSYTAGTSGNLIITRPYVDLAIFNGQKAGETVELTRDGKNWYLVGAAPLIVPMLMNDSVRVSWFLAGPPAVVWLPTA